MKNVSDVSNLGPFTKPTVTYGDNYLQRLDSLLIRNKRGLKRAFKYIEKMYGYHPFEHHGLVDNTVNKLPPGYPCVIEFYQHFEGSMSEIVYAPIDRVLANELEDNSQRNFLLEYDDNATFNIYSLAVGANELRTIIVEHRGNVYCAKETRPYVFQMTCIDSEALFHNVPFGKFKTRSNNIVATVVVGPSIRIMTPCEEYYKIKCDGSAV